MIKTCVDYERYGHILALLPAYDETGECVLTMYDDRACTSTPGSMRSALGRCARDFGCDIPRMRQLAKQVFGRSRQELPLALAPYFVLVPFRYRAPRVKGDTTLAYFNFPHIYTVAPSHPALGPCTGDAPDDAISVFLMNGQSFPVRNNYDSACAHFYEGSKAHDHLCAVINACGPVTLDALAAVS